MWDPKSQTKVGSFKLGTQFPQIALDSSLGEFYAVGQQSYGETLAIILSAYNTQSHALTGTAPFPQTYWPNQSSLMRWGKDGFAFIGAGVGLTDQELYLFRSNAVGPQTLNPVPVLASLSQTSAIAGGAAFTLTVSGSNFVSTSLVEWNGTPLATTFVNAQKVTATVPASDIAAAGAAQVAVYSPAPGGGSSTAVAFNIIAAAPTAGLSTTSLDFGSQAQGVASATQTVKLSNAGNASLAITSIAATGDYTQTHDCGSALASNSSCNIVVTFTPTAAGARTGTLSITDNAPTSPQSVSLTGSGVVDVTIGTQPGGSTSSTVQSGATATYSLELTGAAGFSGAVSLSCIGAPQYATCTLSPSSLNLTSGGTGTFTATVTTSQQSASVRSVDGRGFVLCLIPFVALPWAFRRKIRLSLLTVLVVAIFGGAIGLNGCGGGGSNGSGGGGTKTQNTPPGTYTLTITAASQNASVSQKLTLVVQ